MNMRYLGFEEAFSGGSIYKLYDKKMISQYLSSLTIENALIIFGSKDLDSSDLASAEKASSNALKINNLASFKNFLNVFEEVPVYDKIYHISYDWASLGSEFYTEIAKEIERHNNIWAIPSKNPYISQKLDIANITCDTSIKSCRENITLNELGKVPKKIVNDEKATVFHVKSTSYLQPKFLLNLAFDSPNAFKNEEDFVNFSILKNLFERNSQEIQYNAERVSTLIEFEGKELRFFGFSEKLGVIVKDLLRVFRQSTFSKEDFEALKNTTAEDINTLRMEAPYRQTFWKLKNVLLPNPIDLTKAYEICLSLKNFDYVERFFSKLKLTAFFGGNIDEDQALEIWKDIDSILNYKSLPNEEIHRSRVLKINESQSFVARFLNGDEDNENNAIGNFYMIGENSLKTSELAAVVGNLLGNAAFTYLRTNLQLGYIVFGYNLNLEGFLLKFLIYYHFKYPFFFTLYSNKVLMDSIFMFKELKISLSLLIRRLKIFFRFLKINLRV